jgi:integrase
MSLAVLASITTEMAQEMAVNCGVCIRPVIKHVYDRDTGTDGWDDTSAIGGSRSRTGYERRLTPGSRDRSWPTSSGALQRDHSARVKKVIRYKVRYRDQAGRSHSETKRRLVDAERRKAEIELELANGSWRDPRRGEMRLAVWTDEWVKSRHDLRLTTRARLEGSMASQVLPKFGTTPLVKISHGAVRAWVAEMLDEGLSPATVRKAVFALRQCLAAAMADNRLVLNPAENVPLPSEQLKLPRFLSQAEVDRLADSMPDRYRASVLVGAYAGLRWGEAAGLTRSNVDVLRSRIR